MCDKIVINKYVGEYVSLKDSKKKGDKYVKFEAFDNDYIKHVVDKIEQIIEINELAISKMMQRTDLETASAVYFELKELFKNKDVVLNIFNFANNSLDYNDYIEFKRDSDLRKVNKDTTLEYIEENFCAFDFFKEYCEMVSFKVDNEGDYALVKDKYVTEFNKFKYKKLIAEYCKEKRKYIEERDYIY